MKKVKQSSYEILNISANATAREIKSSYKKLIRQYTPEHEPEKFMEIRKSYEYFTEKMPDNATFPIYKKPFLVMSQKSKSKNRTIDLPIQILSTIFETPFNLEKTLKEDLKQSAEMLGFTPTKQGS